MDNRTHFVVDAQQFINTNEVLFTWESVDVLIHTQAVGDAEPPAVEQYNEDGVICDFTCSVDDSKNVEIQNISLSLVASDGTTTFELDRLEINLLPNVGTPPTINVNNERGYVLPAASEFNFVQLTTGAASGGKQYYEGAIGQKITWQEWIANANVPAVFVNTAQDNDGLNQKTDNYSGVSGYSVYLKLSATVAGDDSVQGRVTRTYEQLSTAIVVRDYNESDDGEIVSGTIETFDSTGTYNLGGSYLLGEDTLFRTTWVGLSPLAVGGLGYIIHRIERENAPGNLEIEESSTLRGAVSSGKLGATTASQSGNDIISECLIKAGSLTGGNWKLSSRIQIPFYPLIITVTSSYAGGYVLIEDLTAATSVSSTTGSAQLQTVDGNSIRITISDDETQDPTSALLKWAGVGNPSTPQDGGTWTNTLLAYPHGRSAGEQVVREKQITFTATQVNTITDPFFNRFLWAVVKYFDVPDSGAFNDLAAADDGNGWAFTPASSLVLDTNAPSTTVSGLTDLTAKDPSLRDVTQPTPLKSVQPAVATFGGIDYIDFINGTTGGLSQVGITNTGDVLTTFYTNAGFGFIPKTGSSAAANGTADSGYDRINFVVWKPTNLTWLPPAYWNWPNWPVVDWGRLDSRSSGYASPVIGKVSSDGINDGYTVMERSRFVPTANLIYTAPTYPDEWHVNYIYPVADNSAGNYANWVASGVGAYMENSSGVIQQDPVNGGNTIDAAPYSDRNGFGTTQQSVSTNITSRTVTAGFALSIQFNWGLLQHQVEDVLSRLKNSFSI